MTAHPSDAASRSHSPPRSSAVCEDLFDSVLRLDEQLIAEGEAEGRIKGEQAGKDEGTRLGQQKAHDLCAEIGFVAGFAERFAEQMRQHPKLYTERQVASIARLQFLVQQIDYANPHSEKLIDALSLMRAKFKHCLSSLHLMSYFRLQADTEQQHQQQSPEQKSSPHTPQPSRAVQAAQSAALSF